MTERRDHSPNLPLFSYAEGQRAVVGNARLRRVRHRRRFAAAAAGIALLATTLIWPPSPRLVWNASTSAPIGLYGVTPGALLARGDMVIAWPPREHRTLAARRHYLPINVPLLKRVRAVPGDQVCASERAIMVAGRRIAERHRRDAAGRTMPWWEGCVILSHGALLLLNDAASSYDGRYFGPTKPADVIGKATPLWLR